MLVFLLVLYGVYVIAVGAKGNSGELIQELSQEKQFAAWIVVIGLAAILGDSFKQKFGYMFLTLVLLSFLLNKQNAQQFLTNFNTIFNSLENTTNSTATGNQSSTSSTQNSSSFLSGTMSEFDQILKGEYSPFTTFPNFKL